LETTRLQSQLTSKHSLVSPPIQSLTCFNRELLGVGGYVENWVPPSVDKDKSMVFTFGNNGFFGYAAASETMGMWWSTCHSEALPANRKLDPEDLRNQLRKRHAHWKDPIIHECIEKSGVSQIYPTWSTPDLPTWSANGLVVVGDAAHALHSTSGQGASMALEDSQCLTLLISKYVEESNKSEDKLSIEDAVGLSLKSFYNLRHGRVKRISDRAKMMAGSKHDMPFIAEMMLCGMMWLMGKVPSLGKSCFDTTDLNLTPCREVVDGRCESRTLLLVGCGCSDRQGGQKDNRFAR
jgi:2-polyprenyl-6-methoxyphenol hydroxylase-like FAD-dependent oxidoreductase